MIKYQVKIGSTIPYRFHEDQRSRQLAQVRVHVSKCTFSRKKKKKTLQKRGWFYLHGEKQDYEWNIDMLNTINIKPIYIVKLRVLLSSNNNRKKKKEKSLKFFRDAL